MACMTNPVFNRSPEFNSPRGTTVVPAPQPDNPTLSADQLQAMYQGPTAGPVQTGRLTYDDVIVKTVGMLGLLVVSGAATWFLAPGLWMVGAVVGLVLGLVNCFKRNPSPALISIYAVAEGMFLGGISKFYESVWDGVVVQAIGATAAVFIAVLVLFAFGKVRASAKMTKIVLVAMVAYLLFSLINVALVWGGVLPGFGMYQMRVAGIPLALGIGVIVVLLGSYSLVMDFDSIKNGVQQGAPAKFAWSAAFGLLVTLVWLYLELLRLLAIFRD
jgi:uncharacterized YccA/Bax inhibitor family protein